MCLAWESGCPYTHTQAQHPHPHFLFSHPLSHRGFLIPIQRTPGEAKEVGRFSKLLTRRESLQAKTNPHAFLALARKYFTFSMNYSSI